MTPFELSVLLFLQIAIILVACRAVGWLGSLVRQPQVVCEMVAGVLLGPSLLGAVLPAASARLFPGESRAVIYCLAQLALALYMFCVGLEFRADLVRARLRSALSISLAGILAPFALGVGIAAWIRTDGRFFHASVPAAHALLFMGAAMSITAFPMLARIIYERGLTGTTVGTLALAAGSVDDALAWCVLAVVLAGFTGDSRIALLAVGGGAIYAAATLTLGRSLLGALGRAAQRRVSRQTGLTLVLALLAVAAWITDAIGIYAVFGAFILGAAMPRGEFCDFVRRTIEPLTTALLLPLFFVYSGLNTRVTLVDTPYLWLVAAVVLLAACAGKGVACALAARWHGESRRDALGIGALMNARGLMELIILNIGLERGIITPTLFSIMVVMAVVTTLMASPMFDVTRFASSPDH